MKKSVVAGIAGTVRCKPLTLGGLYQQERHGKRQDKASKARVIRDIPPLTTTGLNLRELYSAHVEGCFIPRAKTKVIHAIIQWPKDLVDLTDEQGLLDHGIAFAKRVWGQGSVMATRYDRDEKSEGVVDLFVVPKYHKFTRLDPDGKLAVSITKHGKDLAERLGRMTGKSPKGEPQATPWDVGRALQDELYSYMRTVMGIEGVARGQKKETLGPDWKSSEQLRTLELDEKEAALNEREQELQAREQQIEVDAAALRAERKEAEDHARQIAAEVYRSAAEQISQWKADAETAGREAGYAAGLEEGRAKLEVERELARNAAEAAEHKDREKQRALDAARDERRQAELIGRAIIDGATKQVWKWKADAEAAGREAGYRASFEEGRAKLEEEREAARRLNEAAKRKDRDKQDALDAAMRQAQIIRIEAQTEADGIRAKARQEAAAKHEALDKRRAAVEAGLAALSDGDILTGSENAQLRRTLTFRRGLSPESEARLMKIIDPAWDWLSREAERLSDVVGKRVEARQAELDERHNSLRDWERKLHKIAYAQEETESQLAAREEALGSLIENANSAKAAFQTALTPLIAWQQKFEVAQGQLRQVMQLSPKHKIVEAAQAEPSIQAAQAADADYQAHLAAFNALKQKGTGVGG